MVMERALLKYLQSIAYDKTSLPKSHKFRHFDTAVHREIELIALTPMTSSKTRAPEPRTITRDFYLNDKAPF